MVLVLEKPLDVATKVKNLELVDSIKSVLKVAKCRFKDVYQNADLNH